MAQRQSLKLTDDQKQELIETFKSVSCEPRRHIQIFYVLYTLQHAIVSLCMSVYMCCRTHWQYAFFFYFSVGVFSCPIHITSRS